MTVEQIKDLIKRMLDIPQKDAMWNTTSSIQFTTLYKKLFPDESVCSTCTNKIALAYQKINELNSNPQMVTIMAQQVKYKLKDGDVLHLTFHPVEGVPSVITNANLTDEMAEKIMDAHPKMVSRFISKKLAPMYQPKAKETIAPPSPDLDDEDEEDEDEDLNEGEELTEQPVAETKEEEKDVATATNEAQTESASIELQKQIEDMEASGITKDDIIKQLADAGIPVDLSTRPKKRDLITLLLTEQKKA